MNAARSGSACRPASSTLTRKSRSTWASERRRRLDGPWYRPARLLTGTTRALQGDPANWQNHAFHGGALLRNGEHARALESLNKAIALHGKPHPLTHNLLALARLASASAARTIRI